jgi:predicted permease
VLSVGLAIGINLLMFTIISTLFLKPMIGISDPGRVVQLSLRSRDGRLAALSYADFQDYAVHQRSFEYLSASASQSVTITGRGDPREVVADRVTRDSFMLSGIQPRLGRGFRESEFARGGDGVFIASDTFWRRSLGSDPAAVGQSFVLNGVSRTLVGVLPPRGAMIGVGADGVFFPLIPDGQENQRGYRFLSVFGRLGRNTSLEAARADLTGITRGLVDGHSMAPGTEIWTQTFDDLLLGSDLRKVLRGLAITVALVLLIACVNVATIKISRLSVRRTEIGIRMALGAPRGRIIASLLGQSLLEACFGGALGFAFAYWAFQAIQASGLLTFGPMFDPRLDWRVGFFALAVSVLTAATFGVVPALHSMRENPVSLIRVASGTRTTRHSGRLVALCVLTEVCLSVLLVDAALMGFQNLAQVKQMKIGIEPKGRVAVRFSLPGRRYDAAGRARFFTELLQAVRPISGVHEAAIASPVPLMGGDMMNSYYPDGRHTGDEAPTANYYICSPSYFAALGIPVLAGRSFSETDLQPSAHPVVVSRAVAVRFWRSPREALGRSLELNGRALEVVGVAGDVRHSLDDPAEHAEALYTPYGQWAPPSATLVVKSALSSKALADAIRQAFRQLDSELATGVPEPMEEAAMKTVVDAKQLMLVLVLFAGVALILTLVGLYGVTSEMVRQRLREIALRRVLGESAASLVYRVTRRAGIIAGLGLCVGGLLSFGLRKVTEAVVPVVPIAAWLLVSVALTLLGCALLVSVVPVFRVLRTHPSVVLREE